MNAGTPCGGLARALTHTISRVRSGAATTPFRHDLGTARVQTRTAG